MKNKLSIWILMFLIALGAASCKHNEKKLEKYTGGEHPAIEVGTISVAPEKMSDVYQAVGTVQSGKRSVLSAKVMGNVLAVYANEGDIVTSGRLLAKIDSRDIETQVRQAQSGIQEAQRALQEVDEGIAAAESGVAAAQANSDLAGKTFARYEKLKQDNSVSDQEFDQIAAQKRMADADVHRAERSVEAMKAKRRQVESKIEQAKQGLQQAEIMRSFASVNAPFNGIIVQKSTEPGQLAAPGAPLFTIEDNSDYRLEAQVEENFLKYLNIGQNVPVTIESLQDSDINGVVREIVPAVDPSSRSFTVKIKLPVVPNMRSGLYGKANFKRGEINVLSVPKSALVVRGQITGVFVVLNGTAQLRLVKTGRELTGGRVEVLSGLNAGDIVAINNTDRLTDGGKVVVSQ